MNSKDKPKKVRLDILVCEQGFAESRQRAQALILAGQVLTGDQLLEKPGLKVSADTVLRVRGQKDKYVSRAAYKLLGAIEHFKFSLKDLVCLDVGASTGGFTQVCLENGAKKVYAIDVGHNQLHWSIRKDERVESHEGVNVRTIEPDFLPEKVEFVCIDTSFISLKLILPPILPFLSKDAKLVALIKPQHEVGKDLVGKGGIVKDPALHEKVKEEISLFAQSIGLNVLGLIDSPITGTTGNKEFLLYLSV